MNPQTATAGPMTDPDCAAIECLVLDGCHALDAYLHHPCGAHGEELVHLRVALLQAAGAAPEQLCDDVLGVAAELGLAPIPFS